MTTPVVPRIDRPPTMPRRALVVRLASVSPPGIASVTSTSPPSPRSWAISATTACAAGIDRRLADRNRQARPGHHADALAGDEQHAGAGLAAGPWPDHRAVGHVRVIASVLDHRRGRPLGAERTLDQVEARALAARQLDRHGVGKAPGEQGEVSGLGRGRRAGAGGPAPS